MNRRNFLLVFLLSLLFWGACESLDKEPKALLNLILVDAPAQYDSVFVEILGVDVKMIREGRSTQEETFMIPYSLGDKLIRVSDYVAGEVLLLGRDQLPLGRITELTLHLGTRHFLWLDEERYTMSLSDPSLEEITIPFSLEMAQGTSYDVFLDFDLEKSIEVVSESPLSLELNPVVHVYSSEGLVEVSGSVGPIASDPAIYAKNGVETISTHTNSSGTFLFRLPEGTYTLIFEPKNELYLGDTLWNVEVLSGEPIVLDRVTLNLKP
ncbi:DUF4382 domain-containing protein [Algoriphagus sp. CAU 1675]|uniref:DUF4382 domain-containing protein n=1 Tax=Algoriphagus sp. CAU 1675 TaxID=3032597 RepID=UPI0023DCB45F|nr:DUF4382 domain-containing protein [Algoriphagus sp. CAU 1675]MDF2156420.1 DUF4382 domain-containing protein [Algoriphagus sp. CAU 1675]